MAKKKKYYFNFKPVEAIQYLKFETFDEFKKLSGLPEATEIHLNYGGVLGLSLNTENWMFMKPGQWMIKDGEKVIIQDEEPPFLNGWEWGVFIGNGQLPISYTESRARELASEKGYRLYRRPLIRTKPDINDYWVGLWELAE